MFNESAKIEQLEDRVRKLELNVQKLSRPRLLTKQQMYRMSSRRIVDSLIEHKLIYGVAIPGMSRLKYPAEQFEKMISTNFR